MVERPLDLKLLRIFEAIMAERNVSRAAERLELSQSSVSKGLSALRGVFRDPLFIRSPDGMMPTYRAMELRASVGHAIRILENLVGGDASFMPASARLSVTMGLSDYGSYLVLPALISALSRQAPDIRLHTREIDSRSAEDMLLQGQADLCLASDALFNYPIRHAELFQDRYICLARAGHPLEAQPLCLETFLPYRHLVMPKQSGGHAGVVEQVLSGFNRTRHIAVSVSSLLSVPEVLSSTDLVMTTTTRVARKLQRQADLRMHAHPLRLPEFRYALIWHQRSEDSPSHRWLRGLIRQCAQAIEHGE